MKKTALLLITAIILASCSRDFVNTSRNTVIEKFPNLVKQNYVSGIEDMPVYHGFKEQEGAAISYDTTNGRIINAEFYSPDASVSDVKLFYEATLPQLGWSVVEPDIYRRDGETLELNITKKNGQTALKFTIRPSLS
ncbi:MAG: hypothetical protein PQ612_09535 [Rickettsiales bacterium]|nr:hypothetical protein [Pseudomonadota bacterium]MDA0967417.1 hypothetical protein [Pseudomonadota bacterium]MDG4544215.1 hypothetical protein [Rickettsiales bacterium]MDG4546396.1 hypothetical protein [Rickettsiales bacterium]MDG4548539.1 hypothetical protein [Rickettsiales bacterium]